MLAPLVAKYSGTGSSDFVIALNTESGNVQFRNHRIDLGLPGSAPVNPPSGSNGAGDGG